MVSMTAWALAVVSDQILPCVQEGVDGVEADEFHRLPPKALVPTTALVELQDARGFAGALVELVAVLIEFQHYNMAVGWWQHRGSSSRRSSHSGGAPCLPCHDEDPEEDVRAASGASPCHVVLVIDDDDEEEQDEGEAAEEEEEEEVVE